MTTGCIDYKSVTSTKVTEPQRKHSHYFKPCPYDEVDVYRVLKLFNVADPCLQHAIKKILVAGGRGAGKDIWRDIQEAIDTLERWKEMQLEDKPIQGNHDPRFFTGIGFTGPSFCPKGPELVLDPPKSIGTGLYLEDVLYEDEI